MPPELKPAQAKACFFDMDHTLIDNDCDVSWKEFLIDLRIAPENERIVAQRHWDDYCAGTLQEDKFVAFQLRQFADRPVGEMQAIARRHFEERVADRIYPKARAAVSGARRREIPAIMLTATNRVVAEPIASEFGISEIICTELETADGFFTGGIIPPYCIKEGKRERAFAYCREHGIDLDTAAYYGDSVNDVPMLKEVGCPVVVNASGEIWEIARENDWHMVEWQL